MKRTIMAVLVFTVVLSAKSVVLTFDTPASDISGLAWGGNSLWALSAATRYVYRLDPGSGDVISSFYFNYTEYMTPTGLAFSEAYNRVLCAGWFSGNGYVYQYTPEGGYISKASLVGG